MRLVARRLDFDGADFTFLRYDKIYLVIAVRVLLGPCVVIEFVACGTQHLCDGVFVNVSQIGTGLV